MKKTVKISLVVISAILILGYTFLQGMFYANKKATIKMANSGSFYSVQALKMIKDKEYQDKIKILFDLDMDTSSQKLAEMALEYPDQIDRGHYNLLVLVRDYRKQHGRMERFNDLIDTDLVDSKVNEAIAYLESTHELDNWKHPLEYNPKIK